MRNTLTWGVLWIAAASVAAPSAAQDAGKPMLTVHVSGDRVVNDEASRLVEVAGNVRILAYTDDPDSPRVAIRAKKVTVDLAGKVLQAGGAILMRTEQAAFRGENLYLDMLKGDMRLTEAAASMDMPRDDGRVFRGFFFGDELRSEGGSHFVIVNGTLTPCDSRDRPDVAFNAARIVYDSHTGRGVVYRGTVRLLGLSIPMLPKMGFKHGRGEAKRGVQYSLPGYSGYDGLYVPFQYQFTGPDNPWLGTVAARLATRSHVRGTVSMERGTEDYDFGAYFTREEHVTDDITRRLILSRQPEIEYVRRFARASSCAGWQTGVSLGRFQEREDTAHAPERAEDRARVEAGYLSDVRARAEREGTWWGATVTQSFYGCGTRFRDVSVETGVGGRLSDDLTGSLSLIDHLTSGQSPFLFDDVDIEREARGTLGWKLSRRWAFHGDGRYDLKKSSMRDYTLELSRRSEYLTWSAGYDFSDRSIMLRLDINGLTGNTEPPVTRPVVTDDEVRLTPEWVHEGAMTDMQ